MAQRWFTVTEEGVLTVAIDMSRVLFARWATRGQKRVVEIYIDGTTAMPILPEGAGDAFMKALTDEASP